ncbi:hypothetical protein COV18_01005 [Candidatus Woesearchaeota archaeon CG10_big_fil_rev_8_21_14_0_10_37_12]|nr:MAG: hypothetical protein COV18_01005 [Candidatus Woesearchaeota archaeon CG10_big_fil_rev_8_21_14_0_10_37_12]
MDKKGLKSLRHKVYKYQKVPFFMVVCTECHVYKTLKEKCWYYWEGKKKCSQFKQTAAAEPEYKESLIQIR